MRRKVFVFVLAGLVSVCIPILAQARSSYMSSFNSRYGTSGTVLNTCSLCHPGGNTGSQNQFSRDFANGAVGNRTFNAALEGRDSDGDGSSNIVEINARTFPGDANSGPAPVADTTAPSVTGFTISTTSSSLAVSISSLTATDNVGVTGYMLTELSTAPAASATGWTATAPTSYSFTTAGAKTLYAWAKDAANNVSTSRSATTTITLADTTRPTVTAFSIPATSASLTVSISSLTATDNVEVIGYMVTESSAAPTASTTGWTATALASYSFTTAGAKTLYAWAKDAANNVSTSRSATTTITLADTTRPTVTGFTIPATVTSLAVSISSLTASDNVAVTGLIVTESATAPSASAPGWTSTTPASYTFATPGSKTLYAWAKDAVGNVSTSRSAATTITLPDTTRPTVTGFTIPATSTSLTVSISSLTASDNMGVAGYVVTESATAPAASATGWTATAPTSYTFTNAGSKTLYAWAKDAAGNVSASRSATTTLTPPDTTAPTVTLFTIPATSGSLDIPITLAAADNVRVTGYIVSESAATPSPSNPGWSVTPPYRYTFTTPGTKTLYAWARDAAGNVSAGVSDTGRVSLLDSATPTVTGFTIPATSSSLTVSILSFTATDNIGVTGYILTESAMAPAASVGGWTVTRPASYAFTAGGLKTLYAWAKDAAGNVSTSLSATTTITFVDTVAPAITEFSTPGTSDSFNVPVTSFAAVDNVAVTGFIVTESPSAPSAAGSSWSPTPPTSFTFASEGQKTLFAWAKDAAGNVSASRSSTVFISVSLPPPLPPVAFVLRGDFDGDRSDDFAAIEQTTGTVRFTTDLVTWTTIPGVTMAQLITGDFNPARPGQELAGLTSDGGIFVSRDLATWTQIPGELHQLVSGDMNADGQDDLAGINDRDGTVWFTFNLAGWTNIPGMLMEIMCGDFNPARPGKELAGVDGNGTLWVTMDLTTWANIP